VSQHKAAVPEPKEIAGRYQIVQKLGAGAFGTVYKAKDKLLGRMLAIKTIRLEGLAAAGASIEELTDRFKREAQVSAQLKHPNIVTIYDIGEADGVSYLAMEFIDGVGLDKIIAQAGRLPMERAAGLAVQIAEALDFAHKGGVVHRDIKPANIMIEAGDRVKVTDFGIAKVMDSGDHLTMTGSLLGTPSYMSPEQARGSALDGRSDLFAVGCILYEMLAGKKAFRGDSITGLIFKIITEEPPHIHEIDADVPEEMVRIIARALAKASDARYQTGHEMAEDLLPFTRAGAVPTLRQIETPTAGMPAVGNPTMHVNPTVQAPAATVLGAAATKVAPPRPPAPPPPAPPPAAARRAPGAHAAAPRAAAPPAKSSSAGLFIGLAAGAFLLLLAAGGVGWYLWQKPGPKPIVGGLSGTGSTVAPTVPPSTLAEGTPTTEVPGTSTVTPPVTQPPTSNTERPPVTTADRSESVPPANRGTNTSVPPVVSQPPPTEARQPPPRGGEYSFLDEEAAPIDGREAGERVAGTYRSDRGSSGSGGFGATGRLRARERSPRDLGPGERPAVATLRHIMDRQEVFHRKQGRYGTLAELTSAVGFRLDVPVTQNTFERRGYRFDLSVEKDGFTVTALPNSPTGRTFTGDDSGFIRSGTE
jgi:eukaryotic-like serine/threonine-protein kinase